MATGRPDTDELLRSACDGDQDAWQRLIERNRPRLRQMVAAHLDRRIAARVDPSDVVQETLTDAARHLAAYLRERPLPFYPWLHQLARQRLQWLRRQHLEAGRRSVRREAPVDHRPLEESASALVDRLIAAGTSPSNRLIREERRHQVRVALDLLSPDDRDLLVMRHLEGMSTAEIAAILGINPGAVRTRHVRALARLRALIGLEASED